MSGLLCAALASAAGASAQDTTYPVFTADQLDATMKTLGPNVSGVTSAVRDADYAAAKAQAIRSREQLAVTVTFWRDQERADAVRLLRATLDELDALDGLLSAPAVSAASVEPVLGRIQQSCEACHEVYREQDPAGGDYRLRQSALRP